MHVLSLIIVFLLGIDCAWKLGRCLQAGWQAKPRKAAYFALRTLVQLCIVVSWVWLILEHFTNMAFMVVALVHLILAYTSRPLEQMRKAIADKEW